MINVLSVHAGADTGGCGWGLVHAFKGDRDVRLRSAVKKLAFTEYPRDLTWAQVSAEWALADVVHVHGTTRTWRILGGGKPFVLHHHGTHYRNHYEALNRQVADLGGRAVASTIDLLRYGADLVWCPQVHDLDWLARFRRPHDGPLRVGHFPTNRAIKSTDAFLKGCADLGIQPVIGERGTWAETLAVKGTCDVVYDQVKLGYGNNAIEAMAMGIPVIAGATSWTLGRMRDTFGTLPFYEATEATISDALKAMHDPEVRAEYAARGLAHVKRWHDGSETRRVLTPIYRQLAK